MLCACPAEVERRTVQLPSPRWCRAKKSPRPFLHALGLCLPVIGWACPWIPLKRPDAPRQRTRLEAMPYVFILLASTTATMN